MSKGEISAFFTCLDLKRWSSLYTRGAVQTAELRAIVVLVAQ